MEWKLEKRDIESIYENDRNPRRIALKQGEELAKSLAKFGQCEPIVIQKDGKIIGGHQRYRLLKKMGKKSIDAYVPDEPLTEEELDELTIRLNKNQGDWDFDTLANTWEPELLLEAGFTLEELHLEIIEEKEKKKKLSITLTFETEEDLKRALPLVKEVAFKYPLAKCKSSI